MTQSRVTELLHCYFSAWMPGSLSLNDYVFIPTAISILGINANDAH